jgi:catechol 2,3-dioxygenase-like lactoylglutathione lyase family enzyme
MTVHHVSLEIQPADAGRVIEMFELLGFDRLQEPEVFQGNVKWLESGATQIHLILSEAAAIPQLGHVAVVAPHFDETHRRLEQAGFEVEEHQELWGARRNFVLGPGGMRVEFMEFPPPPGG